MPITKLRPSFTLTEDRLAELKAVVPEAFADGAINWDALRAALGEHVESDGPDVGHFGLFWPGKREARRLAAQPSKGALIPAPGEGVNEATTRNLFIEGDNLEVLKLLQKSYAGQVKMIYIDPPYNTGNDFVYKDDFKDPLDDYLRKTGQAGDEGELLTSNPKAGGRFHSNWLSMMYPRLLLARRLLSDDGVIFVSIDDNEAAQLRLLMDEIFGAENFIDSIIWKKRYGGGAKERYLVTIHEYVLMYSFDKAALPELFVPLSDESIARYYKLKDENFEKRGPFRTHPLESMKSFAERKNLVFPITAPDGNQVLPKRQWRWSSQRVEEAAAAGELHFSKDRNGEWSVHSKQYLKNDDVNRETKFFSVVDDVYSQHGTNEIIELFGDAQIFGFPKPSGLIVKLLKLITTVNDEDIVLDFFSGSATSAHAILQQNREDGGNRRFILVQLPEPTDNPKFPTIADIGKERIRRVIKAMKKDRQPKLLEARETPEDLGFKVFKLGRSNYKGWQDFAGDDVGQLETLFDAYESPLVKDWKAEHLLAETLLLEGFPLDSTVTPQKQFARNRVACVQSDACAHRLFVCFNDAIDDDTVAELRSGKHLGQDDIFICLDSALSDKAKLRLADAIKLHVI